MSTCGETTQTGWHSCECHLCDTHDGKHRCRCDHEWRRADPEPVECPHCEGTGKVTGDRYIGVDCPVCLGDGATEPS